MWCNCPIHAYYRAWTRANRMIWQAQLVMRQDLDRRGAYAKT